MKFQNYSKKRMRIGILTALLHQFYLCKMKIYIFYKHFLILPILYGMSKLINFGFLAKKDFCYLLSILDFRHAQIKAQSTKFRKVDAIYNVNFRKNSKLYKIRNFSPISTK